MYFCTSVDEWIDYGARVRVHLVRYVKSINKFKHIDRTENVSSTDIISKIIKNYNHYLIRNLKRGTSSQDLNLHPFIAFALMFRYKIQSGEILIDMENKIDKISENISNTFEKKNRELISNIEEIKSYSNNIKNNLSNNIPIFSKKTFFSGLLLGSLSFYLVNSNIDNIKNLFK